MSLDQEQSEALERAQSYLNHLRRRAALVMTVSLNQELSEALDQAQSLINELLVRRHQQSSASDRQITIGHLDQAPSEVQNLEEARTCLEEVTVTSATSEHQVTYMCKDMDKHEREASTQKSQSHASFSTKSSRSEALRRVHDYIESLTAPSSLGSGLSERAVLDLDNFLDWTKQIREDSLAVDYRRIETKHAQRQKKAKRRTGFKKFWCSAFKSLLKVCSFMCPSCQSCIIDKCAFHPPKPSTYEFMDANGQPVVAEKLFSPQYTYEINFEHDDACNCVRDPKPSTTDYFFARSRRHNWIACAFLRSSRPPVSTIIFSHQNGTDMGLHLFDFPGFQAIADAMECNVCCYDYSGYGQSSGTPSERNMYADIRAVFEELGFRYGIEANDVVLFGYSLGTAACVDFAAQLDNLAGLVLMAPFTSVLRIVIERSEEYAKLSNVYYGDKFKSIEKISEVRAPTLICHGVEDDLVPICHAKMLLEKCKNPVVPCFLDKAAHNNIKFFDEYWIRLYDFLHFELSSS